MEEIYRRATAPGVLDLTERVIPQFLWLAASFSVENTVGRQIPTKMDP